MNRPAVMRHLERQARMGSLKFHVRRSDAQAVVDYIAHLEANQVKGTHVMIDLDAAHMVSKADLVREVARHVGLERALGMGDDSETTKLILRLRNALDPSFLVETDEALADEAHRAFTGRVAEERALLGPG